MKPEHLWFITGVVVGVVGTLTFGLFYFTNITAAAPHAKRPAPPDAAQAK